MKPTKFYIKNKLYIVRGIKSCLFALFLVILSYIIGNISFPLPENMNLYGYSEFFLRSIIGEKEEYDSFFFINIGYDKGIAEYTNPKSNEYLGTVNVTDRGKLLTLLNRLDSIDTYKCIFMDILFEKGFETPYDSLLFSKIKSMGERNRLIFAHDQKVDLQDSTMLPHVGYCDYLATILATNFTKFQYIQSGNNKSAPLVLYNKLYDKQINKHLGGLLFTDSKGGLCYNTLFITNKKDFSEQINSSGTVKWYNLSTDLFKYEDLNNTASLVENKIIVIGDMVIDTHDTYAGVTPGSVIISKAFLALAKGKHLVNWWLAVGYFIIVSIIFYRIMWCSTLLSFDWINNRFLRFGISLVGFGFVFNIVAILLYILLDLPINTFIPTIAFTVISNFVQYKKI